MNSGKTNHRKNHNPHVVEKTNSIVEFYHHNIKRIRKQKPLTLLVLFAVILAFAAMGVGDYVQEVVVDDSVATVGEQQLPITMLEDEIEKFVNFARQQPDDFSEEELRSERVIRQRLAEMIQAQLISQFIRETHLIPSDEKLASYITTQAEFQEAGVFSEERYIQQIRRARMSLEDFEERFRIGMARDNFMPLFLQTTFLPEGAIKSWQDVIGETREVLPHNVVGEKFVKNIKITDEEKQQYYQANIGQMIDPAKVKVKLLEFSPLSLESTIEINDEVLREYFVANKAAFSSETSELRDARHILISFDNKLDEKNKKRARKKIDDILKKVRANPEKFADLATEYTDDPGSKGTGGLYKNIERGMMVPEFDTALFEMDAGDISEVVETQFGYHIIKLEKIAPASIQKFEDVREKIENLYKSEEANTKYIALSESFKLLIDEQSDSEDVLESVASEFDLKVYVSSWVDINTKKFPFDNVELLSAALSEDAANKEAILINPKKENKVWAILVTDTQEQKDLAFAEVESKVTEAVKNIKIAELVNKEVEQKLVDLNSGKENVLWEKAIELNRIAPSLSENVVNDIFTVSANDIPAFIKVGNANNNDVVIYKINKIIENSEFSKEVLGKSNKLYNQYWQSRWIGSIMASLVEKYPVRVNEDVLAKIINKQK